MKNLKKVISSVAALAIVASSASAFALTFPDVDSSASYANAVDLLTALGIVNGDDNGLFNPDNQVTRAEFTKMAVGALGEIAAAEAQTTSQFKDAANTQVHWAAGYVAQGVADGFINGYDDERFGPDDQVTYAQACKMLVAAIGYTSYAEAAGGWPSGYVSQASSLGITKGVSANNDTNLTRSQCAILIANSMDVPLCVIDKWETSVIVNSDGSVGSGQTPVLKKLDGFNKDAKDYQTLLTDKHDAYVVKGRVMSTSRDGGVENDEVSYKVEVADNFDDAEYSATGKSGTNAPAEYTFKFGDTDAPNMQFAYTQAVIKYDEDTDEYTILTITNYGNAKTVEFAADDVADDDSSVGTEYIAKKKIPVYKSATSSTTTKYDLADTVTLYVNGVKVSTNDNDDVKKYLLDNPTGTVTLVDETKVGSTSTDGNYDYIMVTFYGDAVVDYTNSTSTLNRVYFKANTPDITAKLEWDPDDEDKEVKFIKNGEEIEYTDLAEYEVLSIQYDVTKSFKDSDFYTVFVSDQKETGSVTSRDTEDDTVTVGGSEYDVVTSLVIVTDFELGTTYTIYVDAFGYVAYFDEGDADKNYGVIVAMYQGNGDDYKTVRLITSDAKVVAYECKDDTEAKAFYNYAKYGDPKGKKSGETYTQDPSGNFTKSEAPFNENIKKGNTVCTYKVVSGNIKFDKAYAGNGGEDLEYRLSSNKVGSYSINDNSKIIDMDDYMKDSNSGNTVKTLSVSSFEDEAKYDAYFYDKNNDSVYRFGIVFKGTSSIRPETQLAVVQKVVGQSTVNSNDVDTYSVFRGGNEPEEVYVETGATALKEGDVVAYIVGAEGYVESSDLYVLYSPLTAGTTYELLRTKLLTADNFNTVDTKYLGDDGKQTNAIAYETGKYSSKGVYAYVGIVHKKTASSVELFTSKASGKSNVNSVEDFTIGGANVYTFNFGEKAGKGARLSSGNSGTQSQNIYNSAYENDKNEVNWTKVVDEDVTPQIAFIKEVDGDVTDAVFYIAD